MSATFRRDEYVRAAKLNRALLEKGAQAAEVVSFAIVGKYLGQPLSKYGADNTEGTSDASNLINDAILRSIDDGDPIVPTEGLRRCNSPVVVYSQLRMFCNQRAEFRAHFDAAGNGGMIITPSQAAALNPATRERDIRITGGIWGYFGTYPGDVWTSDYTGNVFAMFADDVVMTDITVEGFGRRSDATGSGRAALYGGDRFHWINPRTLRAGSTGGAGALRCLAGRGNRVFGGYLEAGDDCVQCVPGATGIWSNQDIYDFVCVGTHTKSLTSRQVVIATTVPNSPGGMTCTIDGVKIIGVTGEGAGESLAIYNSDSTGKVRNIEINGCSFDDRGNVDRPMAARLIARFGGLENIRIIGVDFKNSHEQVLDAQGNIDGLYIEGGKWDKPAVTGKNAVRIRGVNGGHMRGVDVTGDGTQEVVALGAADAYSPPLPDPAALLVRGPVNNFQVEGNTLRDVPNLIAAVTLTNGSMRDVLRNKVYKLAAATTARGVVFGTDASNDWVDRNDLSECGHSAPIGTGGTNNRSGYNLGVTAFDVNSQDASGGVLAWVARLQLIRVNTAGTVTSITGTPTEAVLLTIRSIVAGTIIQNNSGILLAGSANVALDADESVVLQYDPLNSYWFQVGGEQR